MAALRLHSLQLTSLPRHSTRFAAVLQAPNPKITRTDLQASLKKMLHQKMEDQIRPTGLNGRTIAREDDDSATRSRMYAVAETVADRAEMHAIIADQRADWNKLLLGSMNSIILAAATMAGLSSVPAIGTASLAFKVSATILYSATTILLIAVNKIQPSQLAEEQRNATRLFRQLLSEIRHTIATAGRLITTADVDDAVERVLALDKAYPLPLLPGMLDKFPAIVEPTMWWPASSKKQEAPQRIINGSVTRNGNGWSGELEEEMRGVLRVLKKKDVAEFGRLSKLVLKVNKLLAFCGPFLTGIAAIGCLLIGSSSSSSAALMVAVAAGALATVVNTLEHGGQIGMVFEMYRNCGGFYSLLEEKIESALGEEEVERRENGELFEMKMALQLGRSVSDLRKLSHVDDGEVEAMEFAGKLF